jgi:hypothetical protein
MSPSDQAAATYAKDHLIAKVLIYISYLTIGVVSIEAAAPYVGLIFGTGLWLFGVNSTAYAVEAVRGHEHHHNIV